MHIGVVIAAILVILSCGVWIVATVPKESVPAMVLPVDPNFELCEQGFSVWAHHHCHYEQSAAQ